MTPQAIFMWNREKKWMENTYPLPNAFVFNVCFHPNRKIIASSSDTNLKFWALDSMREPDHLDLDLNLIWRIAYCCDGSLIACADTAGNIILWNLEQGKPHSFLKQQTRANTLSFAPNGQALASGHENHEIMLWDIGTSKSKKLVGHTGELHALCHSSDGKWLASGGKDGAIKLWDVETDSRQVDMLFSSEIIWALAFSPDSKNLVSASDSIIRIWDLKNRKEVVHIEDHPDDISALAFSPAGDLLASAGFKGELIFRDPLSLKKLAVWDTYNQRPLLAISFSPDGKSLVLADAEALRVLAVTKRRGGKIGIKEKWSGYHLPGREWAVIFPDNRYACSPGGQRYLSFSNGLVNYPAIDLPELRINPESQK